MKTIARISAIAMLTAPVQAERLVIEPGSSWARGGYVRDYVQMRDRVEAVEIRGRCLSACNVFLSHANVCLSRKARLGFHALKYKGEMASPAIQRDFANYLGNPALGQWFVNGPAHDTKRIVVLRGGVMIDTFGFPECNKD
ncbi:hypothetical protein [Ruegeria lacuscaerulensis]|uniref:hypothetical protein n=1 Tax=Ruegeria lacuscaerulensis TaxID=55218 RepID=UPI001480DA4E|nr:hypothetical protein [Ruegeria lacuscaerulensis]